MSQATEQARFWCCNPAHLFAGTDADNKADQRAKRLARQGAAA